MKVGSNSPSAKPTSSPSPAQQAAKELENLVDNTISLFEQIDPQAKAQLDKLKGQLDAGFDALIKSLGDPAAPPVAVPPTSQPPSAPPATKPADPPGLTAPAIDLKQGMTGPFVDSLQKDLVKLGYMSDSDRLTGPGIFGPHTLGAVESFQAAWNLPVTGFYGPQTRDALTKALAGAKPPHTEPTGGTANPAAVAREYLGRNAADLQRSSNLDMDKWPASDVDCANFVSAVLEKAGDIPKGQHSDNVNGLVSNLRRDGWTSVPLSQAQPGDVVTFDASLGPNQHVEIFNAWVNGKPQYIGSNNINRDGSQQVSLDTGTWANAVHVWHNPNTGKAAPPTGGTTPPQQTPPTQTPPARTGIPTVDLTQGMTGPQVEMLQNDLVKTGYLSQAAMNTGPGIFGPHTLAAVEAFQSAWGLPVTGLFGPMSREAMTKALAGQKPPNNAPPAGHYPVWLQTDPRWSGMRLIDGSPGENIGPYGCAMTSTAMLLAGSGRTINGQPITSPVVLNTYLQQHQSPGDGDLIEWQTAAHAVGFNAHYVSGGTLNQNLADGHPCVMNIHNGGHWVLVTGRDAQGYICNDPATGTTRHLAGWELNPWNGWAMY